jgi:hypothetical protein
VAKNTKLLASNLISSGLTLYPNVSVNSLLFSKPVHNINDNYNFSGVSLTLDFSIAYSESILIHHQCGGGDSSKQLFPFLKLKSRLSSLLNERLRKLPIFFSGYHCRNTDMKSDTMLALNQIARIKGPIYLASDSREFINNAKAKNNGRLYTFSAIPDFSGRPIHHEPVSTSLKREINTDSILDLFTLGLAQKVDCANTNSGYAVLARNISRIISTDNFEKISFRIYFAIFIKQMFFLQNKSENKV